MERQFVFVTGLQTGPEDFLFSPSLSLKVQSRRDDAKIARRFNRFLGGAVDWTVDYLNRKSSLKS
jgi:hypothetical protein